MNERTKFELAACLVRERAQSAIVDWLLETSNVNLTEAEKQAAHIVCSRHSRGIKLAEGLIERAIFFERQMSDGGGVSSQANVEQSRLD